MPGRIHFGVYELDPEALELRKHGVLIRLQDQPLEVLTALLERPGEVVTREQLQERIWGKDTFVDFEQSLNKAVNRLREALNDDPAHPRYVETVPRRGYRFVAPVTGSTSTKPEMTAPGTENSVPYLFRARKIVAMAAGTLAIAGIIVAFLWLRESPKIATPEVKHVTSNALAWPTLSRDGKLLAYAAAVTGGVPHIWVQQIAGGEAIQVTNGPDPDYYPNFSPDGTHLVYWSTKGGGAIYVSPAFGGEPRFIANAVGAGRLPRFSPDGEKILYWDISRAMIVSVAGGEQSQVKLVPGLSGDAGLWWSPSGEEVLFCGVLRRESRNPELVWIASSLKSGETRRVSLPAADESACSKLGDWYRDENGREWIVYFTQKGLVWTLFRVRVSGEGQVIGNPEPLNSGTGWIDLGNGSVSADGKLAFQTLRGLWSIYEIPITNQGLHLGPTVQLTLPAGSRYQSPSLSADGRWMAYIAAQPDRPTRIVLRDLAKGTDHLLAETQLAPAWNVSISPDGSKAAFQDSCREAKSLEDCVFIVSKAGGELQQICTWCTARGFSPDGSLLLIQKYPREPEKGLNHIAAIDLNTGATRDFLSAADKPLYHAYFSPDGRWVVFKQAQNLANVGNAKILIAPVRDGVVGKQAEWIQVTDGQYVDDKPQFSPDGNSVFFTSTRDGYICIWDQKLNPMTKRPTGTPVAFEHFHNSAGAAGTFGDNPIQAHLSVARDKMVISLPEVQSDVWLTQVK